MLAPAPPWLVGSSANRHTAQTHDLELALGENANLVRPLKALENDFNVVGVHNIDADSNFTGNRITRYEHARE